MVQLLHLKNDNLFVINHYLWIQNFLVEFVGTQTKKTGVDLPVAVAIITIATTTKTKLDIVKTFILKFGAGEIT